MRSLLTAVLMACTTLTGVTVTAQLRFDSTAVLDTSQVTDYRWLGDGEKLCSALDEADCWIENHQDS